MRIYSIPFFVVCTSAFVQGVGFRTLSEVKEVLKEQKFDRDEQTQDMSRSDTFWERELGGSNRRMTLKTSNYHEMKYLKRKLRGGLHTGLKHSQTGDTDFWDRKLGAAHGKLKVKSSLSDGEDIKFWDRELGGSNRQLEVKPSSHDDTEFWGRELGASSRQLEVKPSSHDDTEFWERELRSSS